MADPIDLRGRHSIAAHGSPVFSSTGGPNGTGFWTFNGVDQFLSVDDGLADFDVPADGDFCIEVCFRCIDMYFGVLASVMPYIDTVDGVTSFPDGSWYVSAQKTMIVFDGNFIDKRVETQPGFVSDVGLSPIELSYDWHTLAWDRHAGVLRCFIDGVQQQIDQTHIMPGVHVAPDIPFEGPLSSVASFNIGVLKYLFSGQDGSLYFQGDISYLRFTRASRASTMGGTQIFGEADPLWSVTALMLGSSGGSGGGGGGSQSGNSQVPASESIRLVQVDNGVFDLDYYDLSMGDGPAVETLVYAVLFTDAEAPDDRVPSRYERRGWWGEPAVGSGLWHVRRQPLGSAARREAIEMVRQALEDHAPALGGVTVEEVSPTPGIVSSVFLEVRGLYSGRNFVVSVPL